MPLDRNGSAQIEGFKMTTRVGVAVVGAGGWGRNLIRNFAGAESAELRWICDHNAAALRAMERSYPAVKTTPSFDTVLDDGKVDAVIIATDAPSHFELAKRALDANRDVFVEKPLALERAHAEQLCEQADKARRILAVGHLLLYHPAVDALTALVKKGELGDVLYAYSQRLNLGVVRSNENAWWSLAPHDVSVINHIFGEEPDGVTASGGVFLQKERNVEDVVFATLYFPRGRVANIHVSWLDPHKTRKLTVVGSKKMAVFDDASPDQKLVLFDKGVQPPETVSYSEGVSVRTGDILVPALRMIEPLQRECEAFLEAVRTRVPPVSDGRSGLSVVRTLEAGFRSLRENSRRVSATTSA